MWQPRRALIDSTNCSQVLRAAILVTWQLLWLGAAAGQTTDSIASREVPLAAVRKLAVAARGALAAGKLPPARQQLEQSYVASPSPHGLYQLGRLAEAQGRVVQAADFYRRYLAAAGNQVDERVQAVLRAYIMRLHEPTSEVDVASGDAGALLLLDDEVAGVLPLSGPLLVTAGEHRFTLEKEGHKFQTSPQPLPAGQRAQLQVALESRYAVLTLTPALILLVEPNMMDDSVQSQLSAAVAEAAQKERFFLIDREQTSTALVKSSAGRHVPCAEEFLCKEGLARQLDAAAVLTMKTQVPESRSSQVSLQLLDVPTGMILDSSDELCAACSVIENKESVLRATRKLLQETAIRGRGTLQVASSMAGAKVLIDGRELGAVPFSREAFEGPHEIRVLKDGYVPAKATAQVKRGQMVEVQVMLQRTPEPVHARPRTVRPVRSRWRFIAGSIIVGVGLIFAGFGASGLAVQESCGDTMMDPATPCQNVYVTTVGGTLFGTGAALTIGGSSMMVWGDK